MLNGNQPSIRPASLLALLALLGRPLTGGGSSLGRGAACGSLAARLGCADAAVRELCPDQHCGGRAHPPAPAPLQALPLLFMDEGDLSDPWGHQTLTAPPVVDITARLCDAGGADPACD